MPIHLCPWPYERPGAVCAPSGCCLAVGKAMTQKFFQSKLVPRTFQPKGMISNFVIDIFISGIDIFEGGLMKISNGWSVTSTTKMLVGG